MKPNRFKLQSLISILLIALFIAPTLGAFPKVQRSNPGGMVTAVNGASTDPMTINATLHGRGATFPGPFLSKATAEYHGNFSNVLVNYNVNVPATGSGAGQRAFMNKTDDFDASDAPLSLAQRPLTPGVLHIPDTIGSVTLSYNLPGITQNLNLNGTIIAEIYMGTILNWNDPQIQNINPTITLPNHSILTVHRSDSSGTTFVFTSFLSQDSTAWASAIGAGTVVNWPGSPTGSPPPIVLTGNGNGGVASVIATTAFSFGYVELNYALQNHFTFAAIKNPAGNYIVPSLQSTTFAVENSTASLPTGSQDWSSVNMLNKAGSNTYPIASFTYLLVYQNLNVLPQMDNNETFQATALINFLYWLVNNPGQSLAAPLSYVPLPPAVRLIDNASIASITFGLPSAKINRTIHLSESASTGWNGTSLGPAITIYSGDTINLVLTSADGLTHQWFVDYNNNGVLDANEQATSSNQFSSTTPTSNPPIIPAIGVNVPAVGTYTYRDANNPGNTGTIQVVQQQVAAALLEPTALSSSLNKIDTSKVSTVGTLVINMRTLQMSGTLGQIAVDSTSGSSTFNKNYTITNLQLHTVPGLTGIQEAFALNSAVTPYALSSLLVITLNGVTPTIQNVLTREVDMTANGYVNIIDVGIVYGDFGFCSGQAQYNPVADIVNAGCINIVDATDIGFYFNAPVFR